MNSIYHIVSESDWNAQTDQPTYTAGSLKTEGFIHLSKKEQVAGTLSRYYANVPNLLLLHVDADQLGDALKYEPSTNNELFPHLYGELPKTVVIQVQPIPYESL